MDAETEAETNGATVRLLEADLQAMRDRLLTTTEEMQSSKEELEISKEELQSINEELLTVNAELKARVDELSRANGGSENLLESTQIATIFLDRQFAIKSYTPAARNIFHFVESDVGRPMSHIRSRLRVDPSQKDAERVLRTLAVIEKQVESSDGGKRYIMRMLPYRTIENVIDGVVITYVDVTRITAAAAETVSLTRELRHRVETLERILDLIPAGVFIAGAGAGDDALPHVQVNRYGARLIGDDTERRGPQDVIAPFRLFDNDRELPFWEQPLQQAAYTGRAVPVAEGRLVRRDGSSVDVMMSAAPLFDERGAPRGAIAAMMDISERKRADAPQNPPLRELRRRHPADGK